MGTIRLNNNDKMSKGIKINGQLIPVTSSSKPIIDKYIYYNEK